MSEVHPLKHCQNCAFSSVPKASTVCATCMYNFDFSTSGAAGTSDHWRPLIKSDPAPGSITRVKDVQVGAKDFQFGGGHYISLSVQPWKAMESWMTLEQFRGFLLGCAIKRMARTKGDRLEDLKKARHELDRLIETYHE